MGGRAEEKENIIVEHCQPQLCNLAMTLECVCA